MDLKTIKTLESYFQFLNQTELIELYMSLSKER